MKINIIIYALIMIALSVQAEQEPLKYSGNLRLGMQYHDSLTTGNDIALGGNIHLQTKPLYGLSLGTTLQTTNVLANQHNAQGIAFFSSTSNTYALLSQVYLQARLAQTTLIVGRQRLETPFADSDDIGMIPNTFEAYTLINKDIQNSTFIYSYIRNMSGVDADIPERFSDINGGAGMHMFGFVYDGLADIELSSWLYALPHFANLLYLDADYVGAYRGFKYSVSGQGAWQDFKATKAAKIFGIASSIGYEKSDFSLHLAFNKSLDAAAINGFGGGPFFANDEHMTLADVGKDGSILVYALEWDASAHIKEG